MRNELATATKARIRRDNLDYSNLKNIMLVIDEMVTERNWLGEYYNKASDMAIKRLAKEIRKELIRTEL